MSNATGIQVMVNTLTIFVMIMTFTIFYHDKPIDITQDQYLQDICVETKDKIEEATLEMTVRYNNGTDVKVRC